MAFYDLASEGTQHHPAPSVGHQQVTGLLRVQAQGSRRACGGGDVVWPSWDTKSATDVSWPFVGVPPLVVCECVTQGLGQSNARQSF